MSDDNIIIMKAQTEFALKLLREISNGESSTIVSPTSVAIALSMVYAGAKGDTAKEMNKLLANGAPDSNVHEYFGELVASIRNDDQKKYTLELANKVYVKENYSILDTFKSTINQYYDGLFESVDFLQKQETAKKINHFVEQATHGKIQDIIGSDSFDSLTRLVLINAIYFKGNWDKKFNAEYTQKKTFYAHPGQEKKLDMMHKRAAYFIYSETQTYQILGMPYVGCEVIMFILLPKERYGLKQVLANLSGNELFDLVQMRDKEEVDVVLPKFKMDVTHDLKSSLMNLGIVLAFEDEAQFEGIAEEKPLQINEIKQKAFIEVNEEGTEAAAATFISFVPQCLAPPPPPREFIADHPFAFILTDGKNHQQFFNGTFYG